MAEFYFVNNLLDNPAETETDQSECKDCSATAILAEPFRKLYFPAGDAFLKEALTLKDEVVQSTWTQRGFRCTDPTVYKGLSGTAFMCFRSYQITGNKEDLALCSEIIDSCAAVARSLRHRVTFLCGKAGIYALGAVVAKYKGDSQRKDLFLNLFCEVAQERALSVGPEDGGFGMPYELMYGRAGFLWAALFINKHLGHETIPWSVLVLPWEPVFRQAAVEASELVWKKGLLRKVGLCHGISGNAYTFLALYRLTKEEVYINRAKAFTGFIYNNGRRLIASGQVHGGDHGTSLFEGLAGTACLYFDMVKPEHARFPGFELYKMGYLSFK